MTTTGDQDTAAAQLEAANAAYAAAVHAFEQAKEAHTTAIRAFGHADDRVRRFHQATALAEEVRRLGGELAQLRGRIACDIRDSEGLSLAQLADRLQVSRARAGQLVNIARAADGLDEQEV